VKSAALACRTRGDFGAAQKKRKYGIMCTIHLEDQSHRLLLDDEEDKSGVVAVDAGGAGVAVGPLLPEAPSAMPVTATGCPGEVTPDTDAGSENRSTITSFWLAEGMATSTTTTRGAAHTAESFSKQSIKSRQELESKERVKERSRGTRSRSELGPRSTSASVAFRGAEGTAVAV